RPNLPDGVVPARHLRPDIVFLDLSMPDVSGEDVLVRLKEDPLTAHIPVVIVTSKALDPDERAGLEQHAAAVLSKDQTSRDDAMALIQGTWTKAGLRL